MLRDARSISRRETAVRDAYVASTAERSSIVSGREFLDTDHLV
jgi:hypothetical protein